MHSLSLLPQLFFLAPFGYVLMRGALAALLFLAIKEQWSLGTPLLVKTMIATESVVGIALLLGYMAQLAALLTILLCIVWMIRPQSSPYPRSTILLAAVMAVVIVIGGAGLLAIDLPL